VMLEPFARWRLRYDSPRLVFDLSFRALHRAFSWAEAGVWMEKAPAGAQSRHFDQVGWYEGWMEVEGERISLSAIGMRDRMWGWGGVRSGGDISSSGRLSPMLSSST
jgi:hypothetical protein